MAVNLILNCLDAWFASVLKETQLFSLLPWSFNDQSIATQLASYIVSLCQQLQRILCMPLYKSNVVQTKCGTNYAILVLHCVISYFRLAIVANPGIRIKEGGRGWGGEGSEGLGPT